MVHVCGLTAEGSLKNDVESAPMKIALSPLYHDGFTFNATKENPPDFKYWGTTVIPKSIAFSFFSFVDITSACAAIGVAGFQISNLGYPVRIGEGISDDMNIGADHNSVGKCFFCATNFYQTVQVSHFCSRAI
jgi:hypothetical protein